MPDFSPLLLILLFVGARFLWRRMALEQARRQARNHPQARRPQTPPTPFQEAAPVRHQQVEPEKPSPYTSPVTMSGRGVMESADEDYTERWEEKKGRTGWPWKPARRPGRLHRRPPGRPAPSCRPSTARRLCRRSSPGKSWTARRAAAGAPWPGPERPAGPAEPSNRFLQNSRHPRRLFLWEGILNFARVRACIALLVCGIIFFAT